MRDSKRQEFSLGSASCVGDSRTNYPDSTGLMMKRMMVHSGEKSLKIKLSCGDS